MGDEWKQSGVPLLNLGVLLCLQELVKTSGVILLAKQSMTDLDLVGFYGTCTRPITQHLLVQVGHFIR